MPNLSVLITYYNERELLTQCLDSLLKQPNGPEEVLVYDDGSQYAASNYVPSDSRVRVIREEKNNGPSAARNALLAETSGDYLHFHDSDDWFDPDWCCEVRKAIALRNAEAVFTDIRSYRSNGELHIANVLGLDRITDHDSLIRFCIRYFMLVPAATFKTSFVKRHGGYRTDLWQSEDYEFNVRMALALEVFEVIREPLVSIRLRTESRSRNKIETNFYALEAIRLLTDRVPKVYWNELADKAAMIGRELYGLREKASAKEAFKIARSLGPPKFMDEGTLYRIVAKVLGQEAAEVFGVFYRRYVPQSFRGRFR